MIKFIFWTFLIAFIGGLSGGMTGPFLYEKVKTFMEEKI